MRRAYLLVACIFYCALAHIASAQESAAFRALTLQVIDSATLAPVAGAEVSVPGSHRSDLTTSKGLLRIAVLAAGDTLHIRRLGYRPVVIPTNLLAADQRAVTVGLVAIPRELDDVTIEARAILTDVGFFLRRKRTSGYFVDPDEMLRMHPTRTSDIFERVPGARLTNASAGGRSLRFSRAENCSPNVYVDGVLVLTEPTIERGIGMNRTIVTRANESVNDIFGKTDHGIDEIGIRHIAAVEAYSTGAQAPPPYNGTGASCGVVLFWTWDNLARKPRG